MFNRIINWVKSKFHEETPEEQDKRIHETIKSWKENVDKLELERIDVYHEICQHEAIMTFQLAMALAAKSGPPTEVNPKHLALWNDVFPRIKNKDNALKAWTKWHEAHVYLSSLYCFDVTDPPDGSQGKFNKHVDLRPAKWLKDLANEEKIIKALQMEADANQWKVSAEDIKECEDDYKKSLNML